MATWEAGCPCSLPAAGLEAAANAIHSTRCTPLRSVDRNASVPPIPRRGVHRKQ